MVPIGYAHIFYQNTAGRMSANLYIIMRKRKHLRTLPKSWKFAIITPTFNKGNERLVENYRPKTLLHTDSKVFEKIFYRDFFGLFVKFLTKHQRGFVRKRSVTTNMLSSLQKTTRLSQHTCEACGQPVPVKKAP